MAIRRLTSHSAGALTYDQAGFDIITKDERDVDSLDHVIFYPGVGTNTSNIFYLGNPNPNAYWIGIHNCGTDPVDEVIEVQAVSLVGDNFTADPDSTFDYDESRYLKIPVGDIIYGKFSSVGILKTDSGIYLDRMRLIRGV